MSGYPTQGRRGTLRRESQETHYPDLILINAEDLVLMQIKAALKGKECWHKYRLKAYARLKRIQELVAIDSCRQEMTGNCLLAGGWQLSNPY